MKKINEEEYLKKALKLWGIQEDYINDRIKDRTGIKPVEELYEFYNGKKIEFTFDENGRLEIEKLHALKSMIQVNNSSKAYGWMILPDLNTGILKVSLEQIKNDKEDGIKARYATLTSMGIARKLGLESAQYYLTTNNINEELKNELGYIYSPNFVKKDEELISGLDMSADMETLIEIRGDINCVDMKRNEKLIRIYLKNRKIPEEKIEEVRRSFIKKCVFDKIINDADEANRNWGIIIKNENVYNEKTQSNSIKRSVKMAPMYDYEYGFQTKYINTYRTINGSSDIKDFINYYKKEEWFKDWTENTVFKLNMDEVYEEVLNSSKIEIPIEYKDVFSKQVKEKIQTIQECISKENEQDSER